MKIYLASSWKNEGLVKTWADVLRNDGHEVDAFCDESTGRTVFGVGQNPELDDLTAPQLLCVDVAKQAFEEDRKWLDWADVCMLILPAGNSAHLEAGYAVGSGKKLIIWRGNYPLGEWDVMYGFADLVTRHGHIVRGQLNTWERVV